MVEVEWPWSGDLNSKAPLDACMRCEGALYSEEAAEPDEDGLVYCPECRDELLRRKNHDFVSDR